MHERGPAIPVAVLAGVCGAIQPRINARLGSRIDSPLTASLVNFAVALLVVVVALWLRPGTRRQVRNLVSWDVPHWMLSAGLGGVLAVVAGAIAVEEIGLAVFSVAFFAGQIAAGLVVDRLGLPPGGARPVTRVRVTAAGLALLAVALSQVGRSAGELAPGLVAFTVAAGAGVAFQSAFNGRITAATGDAVAATAVNVAVGTMALSILVGTLFVVDVENVSTWPGNPWLYTGGLIGVTIVFSLALAAAAVGVFTATLAMLAAQLVAALLVDWTVEDLRPEIGVAAGSVLIVVAAALGRSPRGPVGALAAPRSPGPGTIDE